MKKLNIPTVLHICGDTTKGIALMDKSGVNAISVDQKVNLTAASDSSKTAIIVGNLDPVQLLWKGEPAAIKEMCEKNFAGGAKIVTVGCGIVTATSTKNLQAFVEAVREMKY